MCCWATGSRGVPGLDFRRMVLWVPQDPSAIGDTPRILAGGGEE